MSTKIVKQGWRYFKCYKCKTHWRETCRDHSTLSSSKCLVEHCDSNVWGGVTPYCSEENINILVDSYGNLVDEIKIEKIG